MFKPLTNLLASLLVTAFSPGAVAHQPAHSAPWLAPSTHVRTESRAAAEAPYVFGLRKFPYPYKAMLAICSDADHETLRKFNLVHQYLNTTAMTPMGKGLGLDVADSFFMYNGTNLPKPVDVGDVPASKEFTYFKGTSTERYGAGMIDAYIHDGWIDTIHTYGDFSRVNQHETMFQRDLAKKALQALDTSGDKVTVWTDHGNESNVDNFGSYGLRSFYNYQQGANPTSPYYHTDLLLPYGIKFVWTDQQSDQFGHYSMIYPLTLPDGRRVWGFQRYTNETARKNQMGQWVWTVDDLAQQLTWDNLKSIIWQRQYAILAQHLCSNNDNLPLPTNARDALQLLAEQYRDGNILVARTSRLLQYNLSQECVKYEVTKRGDVSVIHITGIDDPVFGSHQPTIDEIRGLTFYTAEPHKTEIEVGDTPLDPSLIQYNPMDGEHPSIGIRWFSPDTHDYAITKSDVW